MTGDPIIAYPNTYTGSIGVLYGKINLRGLYDKLGITKEIISRGRNADIDTDYHPMTESGKAKLGETLSEVYTTFVSKAAKPAIANMKRSSLWPKVASGSAAKPKPTDLST